MKKSLTATLVLGLASSASAQLALRGSDTLFQITQEMLELCQVPSSVMTYAGGGSSGGQNAMRDGLQAIAPMSRFINASGCSLAAPNNQGEGYAHSLDAIGVLADDTEPTNCNTLRYSGSIAVQDLNGVAGLQCPNCTGNNYTFTEWQQVLRIVYAGRHTPINANACNAGDPPGAPAGETKECNSDVRHTLVNNWSNLFEGGCTDSECQQLKHAFRRDDISGTTDTFLTLLSLPAVGNTPFCNGTEFEDLDPIRRPCDGNGLSGGENVCSRTRQALETGKATPVNTVWGAVTNANSPTGNQGDLGLVLSIVIPTTLADQYPNNNSCSGALPFGGSFRFASMPLSLLPPSQQLCPNGQTRSLNSCLWPVDAQGNHGCVNASSNLPAQRVTGFNFDGRVYNLTQRRPNGTIPTEPRVAGTSTVQRPLLNTAYYRIHQRTLQANASGSTCQQPDSTEQIGCLVHASPCSIGFSGLTADLQDPNKVLQLGAPAGGQAVAATEPNVRRLLETCAAGDFDLRYPLSRKLYLNTLVGFANVPSTAQQDRFAACWADRRLVDRAAAVAGFITLDDNGCGSLPLPANPGVDAPPSQCDLSDDVPNTEIESCD